MVENGVKQSKREASWCVFRVSGNAKNEVFDTIENTRTPAERLNLTTDSCVSLVLT